LKVAAHGHGCRDLLVYCGSINCSHGATLNADHMPDDTPIRPLGAQHGLFSVRSSRCRCPAGLQTARQQAARFDRHFGMHARMTLTATPARCGRKAARLSDWKVKVPPGVMA
jgi:hypothetical protein